MNDKGDQQLQKPEHVRVQSYDNAGLSSVAVAPENVINQSIYTDHSSCGRNTLQSPSVLRKYPTAPETDSPV
eukprot:jgi/Chrzof1/9358/UNPLg00329.t1